MSCFVKFVECGDSKDSGFMTAFVLVDTGHRKPKYQRKHFSKILDLNSG